MGFLDSLFGGSKEDDYDEEGFVDEGFEEDMDDGFEEDEYEDDFGEEVEEEWDSAYKFLDDMLEMRGFSGMKEFMNKAMVHRINNSHMYRDRIAVGHETMQMINDTVRMAQGEADESMTDYEALAKQLKSANELINEVEEFTNEEDQMVWSILQTAQDGISALRESGRIGANTNTRTTTSQEEL